MGEAKKARCEQRKNKLSGGAGAGGMNGARAARVRGKRWWAPHIDNVSWLPRAPDQASFPDARPQLVRTSSSFWLAWPRSPAAAQHARAMGNKQSTQQMAGDFNKAVDNGEDGDVIDRLTEAQLDEFREAFASFDKDGGGSIDAGELKELLASVGEYPSDEELHSMVSAVDADGTGGVCAPPPRARPTPAWQIPGAAHGQTLTFASSRR